MNKKLKNTVKDFYDRSSLTSKIRYSYLVILIPIFLFLIFCSFPVDFFMSCFGFNSCFDLLVLICLFHMGIYIP